MIDFDVTRTLRPETRADVAAALADSTGESLRIVGHGTTQHRIAPPPGPVATLELGGLDRITRVDAADLTASVEPGVRIDDLAAELERHRLCLPVHDSGTSVGGVFARGSRGALAPGGHHTRSLLLGFEGVLAEGRPFKAGARVVKSVAGFDLAKAFVGSRGLLFAVTELHLKLRPLPEHAEWFAVTGLDSGTAVERFHSWRRRATPLAAIVLRGTPDAKWSLFGRAAGHRSTVHDAVRELEGQPCEAPSWRLDAATRISGGFPPAAVIDLLRIDPRICVTGGLQFELEIESNTVESTLAALAALGCSAAVTAGAPELRRAHTPIDPAAAELTARLRAVLDPRSVLA
ncbi:MAG: FAD-binding oxidoreductase [Planctomycetes bacterium]|nr:FAD-binding oxidoreductase [Planctomycetota bacterium]